MINPPIYRLTTAVSDIDQTNINRDIRDCNWLCNENHGEEGILYLLPFFLLETKIAARSTLSHNTLKVRPSKQTIRILQSSSSLIIDHLGLSEWSRWCRMSKLSRWSRWSKWSKWSRWYGRKVESTAVFSRSQGLKVSRSRGLKV